MKKIIIAILIIGFGFGGYFLFNQFTKNTTQKCEDGFRFNPATRECQSIEQELDQLDITQIPIQIPGEGISVLLKKDEGTTQYSSTFALSGESQATGFISLNESEVRYYSDDLIIIPFLINTGGTGQFVYIGLFNIKNKTHTSSVFVGDRIGIDSIDIEDERIFISFKTRHFSEGFTSEPTLPVEMVLTVQKNILSEIIRIENASFSDVEIKNSLPLVISSSTKLQGAIPGFWYFEASAQYRIFDNQYNEIATGTIQALSDWMTTNRVPFELSFNQLNLQYKGLGVLVIQSENVRGDEEGEKSIRRMYIPIEIK